ncbi:MAG: thiosulfate oxidation carrier protein SoxY [Burkholderiaceae bacterium]|nr:MAG: thiosulfate oxidation carrier protein SoxY [Burkholderiaceae bacterium]
MYLPHEAVPGIADPARRITLKTLGIAGIGIGIGCGLAMPALAANAPDWPADAFSKKNEADALKALYGKAVESSDKISLEAPEIAENGAVVPVSVSATLPNVTSIAFLVADNPFTLAAVYRIPPGTQAAVDCRLKMGKTSKVIAVVESGGKLYSAAKDVKVTLGGCGG